MPTSTQDNPFLTEVQLAVFTEFGVAVRYNREWRRDHVVGKRCKFGPEPAEQAAHRIPYHKGVLRWHLRPDFLNEPWNLVATCRDHNKEAEWSEDRIERYVAKLHERAENQR